MPTFLALPAELRLRVYNAIISLATEPVIPRLDPTIQPFRLPTVFELEHCAGFLLSCRTINTEFEAEWVSTYNKYLSTLTTDTSCIKPMTRLADSNHLEVQRVDLSDVVGLMGNLPSFEFRLSGPLGTNKARYLQMLIWECRMKKQGFFLRSRLSSEDPGDGTLIVGVVWHGLAKKRCEKGLTWRGA